MAPLEYNYTNVEIIGNNNDDGTCCISVNPQFDEFHEKYHAYIYELLIESSS